MTNYKKFRIIGKIKHTNPNWIKIFLNDYVDFNDERKDSIYCEDIYPFNTYEEGDYIEIDLEITRYHRENHDFNGRSVIRKVSSSNELVSRNSNSLSINQNQQGTAIQMLNRAIDSDPRNKYTASMEVDPKTGNVFYHLSGERK